LGEPAGELLQDFSIALIGELGDAIILSGLTTLDKTEYSG